MTADEWEAAFHGIELPETIQLGPGVFVNDVQAFIDNSLTMLRAGNVRVSQPIEWRVETLLAMLNKTSDEE